MSYDCKQLVEKPDNHTDDVDNQSDDQSNETDNTDDTDETDEADGNSKDIIIHNSWTTKNIKTVQEWESIAEKSVFTHNILLEKYNKKVGQALISVLIFGSLATLLSCISSTISAISSTSSMDTIFRWIVFGINVAIFILSAVVTIINGIIKIRKWNTIVADISAFIEKMDAFYMIVSSILLLQDTLRPDAIDFIKKEYTTYLNIMKSKPEISQSDYNSAEKKYGKYVENNSHYCKYARGRRQNREINLV